MSKIIVNTPVIKQAVVNRNITYAELGRECGIPSKTIRRWMTNKCDISHHSTDEFIRLAHCLGLSVSEVFVVCGI